MVQLNPTSIVQADHSQEWVARLKVAGDRWTVQMGDGTTVLGSGSHRVEIDGNKLTFHGMMPGLSSNEEQTIGYGLWQVDGDTLTYLMTPAVAESALNGQGESPIQFPDSFETKGTKNNVFRLRRIQASTPPTPSSSTNQPQSKSSPEFPPVKIVVRDEEGKPLEGVKIPLGMQQVSAVDHGSARSVVEAYVAAAMANDRKTVQSLSRGNPQEPEQLAKAIDALTRNLTKLDSLATPTVFVNSPDCPSKGIALTETLKWEPRINPSDDLMEVRLRFELSMSDQRWSVTEIGIETEELADELLTKFLEDNPTAISVLSKSRTEKALGGNTKFLVLDCEEIHDFRRILGLSQLEELYINQFVHPGTDFRILKALPHLRKLTFSKWSGLSSDEIAAIAESLPGIEFVEEENQVNRKDARSVVEAYVASALAGDVATATALAKNSPAHTKRIRELPEFLNVQRLTIETVYINDPAKPTQALATSVAVKLDEEHKQPDGRRDGFMVFTLEFTEDKWSVSDIDFETDSGAEKQLNKFLQANPNSIGIPPQTKSLSR